ARFTAAVDVEAGYNPYSAAQAMIDKSSHSWEWGTAAEALLELYDSQLSVFGSNPFPGGKIPSADPSSVFALRYAKQFINVNGQVLVSDSAVGDPASLGVSAILIGQSDGSYIDAANRQADYILNQAPKWSNGAISQRPDVAEIWADNMAMSFPFLAYLAVQKGDTSLMDTTVTQCGLHRAVLKAGDQNWRHIIGPQSQDTGLWSTGNGWAAYGMVRVLHTLQKWSGSSSMTSQASQLKGWIKEILDGAMSSSSDGGLLRNYLNDNSWFGEISGTAILSAVAYRMAVNDPGTFGSSYISWADNNRKVLAQDQSGGAEGIFSPAVDPYSWLDRNKYTSGSPEGQAFGIYLYTAYRDCVAAGVCAKPASSATTISKSGIGPHETLIVLHAPVKFTAGSAPTGVPCDPSQSCDTDGCQGSFNGLSKYPVCKAGPRSGCQCKATSTTCGAHQSCDLNGCAGEFNGLVRSVPYATCTKNFIGCECSATSNTCGLRQSCDLNGCEGKFNGISAFPQCSKNFIGCECTATTNTCGSPQSCDLNGCSGSFNLSNGISYCSQNFVGFPSPVCTGFFKGCECTATSTTCGAKKSCDLNGCAGGYDSSGVARCQGNFHGCACTATSNTCGAVDSCSANGCNGAFNGGNPICTGNKYGCPCRPDPIWIPPPP
ncbi:Six-hairpin glycosidase-like protein, partial [Leptodontidium sp. 2 PMI_412]